MTTNTVSTSAQATDPDRPKRRYDIDWLRVLAVLLLFYVHPAKIFYGFGPWYVQNPQKSQVLSVLTFFIEHWHMQLLFLLAGAATWFALGFRSSGEYVKERFKRLLIPCLFGILVIVPPQIYIERLGIGRYSYIDYYPKYFDPQFTQGFDMGHLWFIAYLFGYSLLALPLFLFLKRDAGKRVVAGLASFMTIPGAIFLFALPIMVMDYILYDFYPNPFYFFTFFLYGYLLLADERFEKAIDRHKLVALVLGVGLYAVWFALVTQRVIAMNWLGPVQSGLITWCCLIAVLGYGKKLLIFTNRFLKYANEASYPVYILHQTVIVFIGYYVIRWNAGVLVKFLAVVLASLALTTLIYDILVKRTNITRFLFGMRPRKRKPPETPT